jgi:Flp pilus assembly protein TadD
MLQHHRLLAAVMALAMAGCQSDGLSRQSWFPLAQRAPDSEKDTPVGELVPAMSQSNEAQESPSKLPSSGPAVARERIEALVSKGQTAIRDQKYDAARAAFAEVLVSTPDNTTAHHGLAIVGDLTEDWIKAEYHYKRALRNQPHDANLLNDLGYSYLLQNRFHESSRYLNQAVQEQPQHEHAQINLAMLSLKQGDRADAQQRLNNLFAPASAQQHLARLEKQIGLSTSAPAVARTDDLTIPAPDAPFAEVMELAAQQRHLAEVERQQRSTQGTSGDDRLNGPAMTVSAPIRTYPAGPVEAIRPGNVPSPQAYPQFVGQANRPAPVAAQTVVSPRVMRHDPPVVMQPTTNNQPARIQSQQAVVSLGVPTENAHPNNQRINPNQQATIQPLGIAVPIHATGQINGSQDSRLHMQANYPRTGQHVVTPNPNHAAGMKHQPVPTTQTPQQDFGRSNDARSVTVGVPVTGPGEMAGIQLGGLNAGPGSLFPVHPNQSAAMPGTRPASEMTFNQSGGRATANIDLSRQPAPIMSPGTNSMLNGAMYPSVPRTLPGQQLAARTQPAGDSTSFNSQGNMNTAAAPATSQFPAGWVQPSGQIQHTGMESAGAPFDKSGRGLAAPNPMSEYEHQLQQVDSQYNQTLEQMARGGSTVNPVQAHY